MLHVLLVMCLRDPLSSATADPWACKSTAIPARSHPAQSPHSDLAWVLDSAWSVDLLVLDKHDSPTSFSTLCLEKLFSAFNLLSHLHSTWCLLRACSVCLVASLSLRQDLRVQQRLPGFFSFPSFLLIFLLSPHLLLLPCLPPSPFSLFPLLLFLFC